MKKCFIMMRPKNWSLIHRDLIIMNNPARKIVIPITIFLLLLILWGAKPSWGKGPLDREVADFDKQILTPILVKANLCSSRQDCTEHGYFFYTAWDSISCDLYGITNEQIIREIFLAILNSGLKVSAFRVWRSTHQDKSFFEKPILEFIDHTGGK